MLVDSSLGFRVQSVAVRGQLYCGDKPAANTLVQLYDEDDGPDPDDMLDKVYTSEDGSFELKGDTMELTNIDPEIRIYHDCAMHLPLCKRNGSLEFPTNTSILALIRQHG
uniref:Transthyretin-like family protein n=1 Tax=Ditylenchus dipsaci TaxID=166011 RepID=A0A915ERU3_9BILA